MATIVIPACNEAAKISKTLKHTPKKYNVIVVDDGSSDSTAKIVSGLGFECIQLKKNMGKGYACRIGAEHADSEIVFMDADAQFSANDIPKFIKTLKHYDIVLGERIAGIPLQRRAANRLAAWLVSRITKRKFRDVLCGFRAIKKSRFFELELKRNGYEFESEMLIKAVRKGMNIGTVPVTVHYDRIKGMTVGKSIWLGIYLVKEALKPFKISRQ
ncbi:MAG: glycosyltransferase family 2 protein [Candidatus Aenigmarchaeota archaeon]|nr:glycosyltransferase family 2 protein [Candidatus Aenigmarchaeota archaeon]